MDPVDHPHSEGVVVGHWEQADIDGLLGCGVMGISVSAFHHHRIMIADRVIDASIALIVDMLAS